MDKYAKWVSERLDEIEEELKFSYKKAKVLTIQDGILTLIALGLFGFAVVTDRLPMVWLAMIVGFISGFWSVRARKELAHCTELQGEREGIRRAVEMQIAHMSSEVELERKEAGR